MKPKRFYYILIAVISVASLGGLGLAYLQFGGLQTQADKVRAQMVSSTLASERIEQIDELRQEYDKVAKLKPVLDRALPYEKQQSSLVLKLEQLARSAGMSIPAAGFTSSDIPAGTSQTVPSGNVLAMPISFELTGSYEQLQSFLKGLERLDRYTSVSSIAISRVEGKAKTLKFQLSINAFLKP